jgi:hypothetical protein
VAAGVDSLRFLICLAVLLENYADRRFGYPGACRRESVLEVLGDPLAARARGPATNTGRLRVMPWIIDLLKSESGADINFSLSLSLPLARSRFLFATASIARPFLTTYVRIRRAIFQAGDCRLSNAHLRYRPNECSSTIHICASAPL